MGLRRPGLTRVGMRRAGSAVNSGSVTSIIAGTNVTISSTGAGGTGDVTVNASEPTPGGAPPAIASVSSGGAASTFSRSDHTHALDVVAYNPSLAGMQASGVVQQTYAAPTATPSVLNLAANLIPFGAPTGTGLLTTQPGFGQVGNGGAGPLMFLDASNVTPTAASIAAQMHLIVEAGFSVAGFIAGLYANASTFGSRYRFQRSRGTFAAPTSVAAQDAVGEMNFEAHNGTTFLRSVGFLGYVDDTATIDGTHSPVNVIMAANNGAALTHPVPSSQVTQMWSYAGDIVNGFTALAPAATQGFIWERAMTSAGNPTGVPLAPTRIGVATSALATVVNPAQLRRWSYISGAWHFLQFMDYDPGTNTGRIPFVGAAVHTLTDSSLLTFDGLGTLTVGDTTGTALINLKQLGGGGNIQSSTGDVFLAGNPGASSTTASVRITGGVGVDSVRVYQDMISFFGNGAASATLTQNVVFFDNRPAMQGGRATIFIHDRAVAPTGNPANGGYMYSEGGELRWRSSGGSTSQLTPIVAVANGAVVVALGAFGPAGSSATPTRWCTLPDGLGGTFTMPSFT